MNGSDNFPARGSVCAVVVTHNRLELLKKCLDGINRQTRPPDQILVVNNESSDGTESWLQERSDLRFITQGNEGNAGGQKTGIQAAMEAGYDWFWCMDDDVVPLPGALQRQLQVGGGGRLVLSYKTYQGELVRLKNYFSETSGIKMSAPPSEGEVERVNFGHFEGMLIPRLVVEKIGLPDERFFVWGEDIIYGYLASKVTECLLPKEPLFEKLLPEGGPKGTPSSLYFPSRNHLLILRVLRENGQGGIKSYWVYTRTILGRLRLCLTKTPRPLWSCRLVLSGVWDGVIGNWGKGQFFSLMKK